jgi:hypothetical protein
MNRRSDRSTKLLVPPLRMDSAIGILTGTFVLAGIALAR